METIQSIRKEDRTNNDDQVMNSKKTKCPRWESTETFKSFLDRLEIWDKIEKGTGKYLDLIDSLQTSGRMKEKEKVEIEVRNNVIDPASENAVTNLNLANHL